MRFRSKEFIKAIILLAAVLPAAYAHEYGPDWGYTAAPGDNKTACVSSGCHTGTVNSGPSGANGVQIILPSGNGGTYTPGQTMLITVKVTDSSKVAFGFQLTARMGSGNAQQAGLLTPIDANTQIICEDGSTLLNTDTSSACPAAFPIQDIEHTLDGWTASYQAGTKGTFSFQFNWTAPSSGGTVTFYAAGNAGVGQPPVASPSNVYTTNLALKPGVEPTITQNGVVPIYSSSNNIEPGSWISIFGSNFAASTATWNGDYPTSLGGVQVTMNGKPAYLWFVGPTQINVQVPDDPSTGTVNVVVQNGAGSATSTAVLAQYGPTFSMLDGTHPAGEIPTPNGTGFYGGVYDIVGPTGALPYNTRPVKKGETVELFGTGFGPTSPAVPAGQHYTGFLASTKSAVAVSIGGVVQNLTAYEIDSGLYQINVTIPSTVASGDVPLVATVGGVSTPSTVRLAIQ